MPPPRRPLAAVHAQHAARVLRHATGLLHLKLQAQAGRDYAVVYVVP